MTVIQDEPVVAMSPARGKSRRVVVLVVSAAAALLVTVVVVVALTASGRCGSGRCSSAGATVTRDVAVSMQNYRIDLPRVLTAGRVRFVVTNLGPTMHEFNIARSDLSPTGLPRSADGTVDDRTRHPGFVHLDEVEGIDLAQHKTLTVTLTPGDYVVYCNMDGHYLAGMTEQLTVTA